MDTFTAAHIAEFDALHVKPYHKTTLITAGFKMPFNGDLKVVADDGWKIDQFKVYRSSLSSYTFTKARDNLSATLKAIDLEKVPDGQDTTFYGFMIEIPKVYFKPADIDAFTNNNVIATIDDELITELTEITANMTVLLTAENGWNINSFGFFTDDGSFRAFEVDPSLKTASYTGDFTKIATWVVDVTMDTPDVLNVNDIYRVDDDIARLVSGKVFEVNDGITVTKYTDYIIGLITLPLKVPDDLIVGEQTIRLNKYDTGINAELMTVDKITVDMGSIETPLIKDNFLDFTNTVTMLHLPYAKSVVIDNNYVIGETISIEYLISFYDGTAIINVKSTKTNSIVYTTNIDLNISLPFGNIETTPMNNSAKNIELGGYNGIHIPYVEVLSNAAILENGFFTIPVLDESLLSLQTGFLKVEDIELKSGATSDEKRDIINILTNGVIIND